MCAECAGDDGDAVGGALRALMGGRPLPPGLHGFTSSFARLRSRSSSRCFAQYLALPRTRFSEHFEHFPSRRCCLTQRFLRSFTPALPKQR